jgi:hypothetical protein
MFSALAFVFVALLLLGGLAVAGFVSIVCAAERLEEIEE